jgi:hypothetical protein
MQTGTPPLEADGVPLWQPSSGHHKQAVLTCHEAGAVVQRRLRIRMAAHGEVVLRQRFCHASECRAMFFLCSHCDRGQRYCSLACRRQARLCQHRLSNRRYQQSPEGRLDHRDRQQQYRERRCRARVTDQGSLLDACSASSSCGAVEASSPDAQKPAAAAAFPRWPENRLGLRLCCRVCGRVGRFIDQFPPIPRRR